MNKRESYNMLFHWFLSAKSNIMFFTEDIFATV